MTLQHHSWAIITSFRIIASEERGKKEKEIVKWNSNYPSYRLGYRFRSPSSHCASNHRSEVAVHVVECLQHLPSNSLRHLFSVIINTLHARRLHNPPLGCSTTSSIC